MSHPVASPPRRNRRKRTIGTVVAVGLILPAAGLAYGLMPASAATAATATFTKTSDWGSGWQASVAIKNGDSALSSWKVEFDLPAGSSVGNAWDATLTKSGQHFSFANAGYNGKVGAGASVSFGFIGSGTGSPLNCLLNGKPCGGGGSTPTTAPTLAPSTAPTTVRPSSPPTSRPPVTPTTRPSSATPTTAAPPSSGVNLDNPAKKEIAMEIVSAAENSSLNWRAQFSYIEDIKDGRGYTAGIIGFCSGTGDMLELVQAYTATKPGNVLAKYLPALQKVNNSSSHAGLDPNFTKDWKTAAADPVFQAAQESERDRVYFNPSVAQGKTDGVGALGQFAYYDASVVHGFEGMESVRSRALKKAKPPSQGGNETTWLNAFLDERVVEMKKEEAHSDVTRIETAQRVFLKAGNFDLKTPLKFSVYGDSYTIN